MIRRLVKRLENFCTSLPHFACTWVNFILRISSWNGIKKRQNSCLSSVLTLYPGSDLNRYVRNGHRILSPACLPIPPPGHYGNQKKASRNERSFSWSERRGSNPRPRPWQGRALPTELLSHNLGCKSKYFFNSAKYFFEIIFINFYIFSSL